MIRKAKVSDVPSINHLRLQVQENVLSDPGLVTEQMTREAITRLGRGIGHQLLDAAVNWLWSRGVDRITLGTDPGTRAEKFYRDRGWRAAGTRDNGEILFELVSPGS